MSSVQNVDIPKMTRSQLDEINNDGVVTNDELRSVGIDPTTVNTSDPKAVREALYDKYLEDHFGLSAAELDQLWADDQITEEEIAEYGLNVHGTQAQLQEELISAKLGKDLGLTPQEIEMVMSASHKTQAQLLEMLSGAQGTAMAASVVNASNTITSKGGAEQEMIMITSVAPPPPPKEMGINEFISALMQSMAYVLQAKAGIQSADVKMNEARLNDIIAISEQKIKHQTDAVRKQVRMLRQTIEHLNTMHALMIAVTVIALVLVLAVAIALGAAAIIASGGALTPLVIAAIVALTILVLAAMTAATLTITEAEMNRQDKSMYKNQQEREAVFWTLTAIQIVTTFGASAVIVAAIVAAQTAAQIAVAAVQMSVQQMVTIILTMVSMMIANIASLMQSTKVFTNAAEEKRDDRKEEAQKKADEEKDKKVEELDKKFENGEITKSEYNSQRREETKKIDAARRQDELAADNQYKKDMKELETVGYVLMALAIASSLGAAAAGAAASSAATQAAQTAARATAEAVASIVQFVGGVVQSVLSLVMAIKELEFKNFQVKVLEEVAEQKEAAAIFAALEKLFSSLKSAGEELMENGTSSMQRLVEALNSVIQTNFSAMEKMAGKSV